MVQSKKGITPVIAVILLLMMTVAAAGAAFFWFIRIQGEMQGGTEQYSESLSENIASRIDVDLVEYVRNETHGNLTFIFKNTGNARVPLSSGSTAPKTTWILSDANQKIVCNDDWSGTPSSCHTGCGSELSPKNVQKVVLELSGACNITDWTTYPNGTFFYFQVDFSGRAATGGSFEK